METQTVTFPRLGYTLAEAEVLTGYSRATLYRMAKRGELRLVRFGRRQLVPTQQLERLLTPQECVQ